jgi:hypothetical protein
MYMWDKGRNCDNVFGKIFLNYAFGFGYFGGDQAAKFVSGNHFCRIIHSRMNFSLFGSNHRNYCTGFGFEEKLR